MECPSQRLTAGPGHCHEAGHCGRPRGSSTRSRSSTGPLVELKQFAQPFAASPIRAPSPLGAAPPPGIPFRAWKSTQQQPYWADVFFRHGVFGSENDVYRPSQTATRASSGFRQTGPRYCRSVVVEAQVSPPHQGRDGHCVRTVGILGHWNRAVAEHPIPDIPLSGLIPTHSSPSRGRRTNSSPAFFSG